MVMHCFGSEALSVNSNIANFTYLFFGGEARAPPRPRQHSFTFSRPTGLQNLTIENGSIGNTLHFDLRRNLNWNIIKMVFLQEKKKDAIVHLCVQPSCDDNGTMCQILKIKRRTASQMATKAVVHAT